MGSMSQPKFTGTGEGDWIMGPVTLSYWHESLRRIRAATVSRLLPLFCQPCVEGTVPQQPHVPWSRARPLQLSIRDKHRPLAVNSRDPAVFVGPCHLAWGCSATGWRVLQAMENG